WHSLRWVWHGEQAFHRLYRAVSEQDIPFGQDCMGDQFLLRGGSVAKLFTETGDTEELNLPLMEFLEAVQADPVGILGLSPLLQLHAEGGTLKPGELLNSYPPFCTKEASRGVSLAGVPAQETLCVLAELSKHLAGASQDNQIECDIKD